MDMHEHKHINTWCLDFYYRFYFMHRNRCLAPLPFLVWTKRSLAICRAELKAVGFSLIIMGHSMFPRLFSCLYINQRGNHIFQGLSEEIFHPNLNIRASSFKLLLFIVSFKKKKKKKLLVCKDQSPLEKVLALVIHIQRY